MEVVGALIGLFVLCVWIALLIVSTNKPGRAKYVLGGCGLFAVLFPACGFILVETTEQSDVLLMGIYIVAVVIVAPIVGGLVGTLIGYAAWYSRDN
jgi:hypothetical protein